MIGPKLRQLRKERHYSLRMLAQKTGLSHSFICDIEHDRCNPSIENLKVLAKALRVKPEIFLSDEVVEDDLFEDQLSSLDPTGTD